jgi:hypothetical protein
MLIIVGENVAFSIVQITVLPVNKHLIGNGLWVFVRIRESRCGLAAASRVALTGVKTCGRTGRTILSSSPSRVFMELTPTTPAVLFPAISLLFLAYTNRFLHLSALVRKLHSDWLMGRDPGLLAQVRNLKVRIELIRWCQAVGVISLLGCLAAMLLLLSLLQLSALILFVASVVLMAVSLMLSLWEILLSGGALNIYLRQMEESPGAKPPPTS